MILKKDSFLWHRGDNLDRDFNYFVTESPCTWMFLTSKTSWTESAPFHISTPAIQNLPWKRNIFHELKLGLTSSLITSYCRCPPLDSGLRLLSGWVTRKGTYVPRRQRHNVHERQPPPRTQSTSAPGARLRFGGECHHVGHYCGQLCGGPHQLPRPNLGGCFGRLPERECV